MPNKWNDLGFSWFIIVPISRDEATSPTIGKSEKYDRNVRERWQRFAPLKMDGQPMATIFQRESNDRSSWVVLASSTPL